MDLFGLGVSRPAAAAGAGGAGAEGARRRRRTEDGANTPVGGGAGNNMDNKTMKQLVKLVNAGRKASLFFLRGAANQFRGTTSY